MPTLPIPIQHSPGIPRQSNKARRKIKRIQRGKEIVKISLFADNMILNLKDPKKLHLRTLRHQQWSGIQNQLTKISSLFIHQQ
jgi:hypothetical protein